MSFPEANRCVLRTTTIADFKAIMGYPIGSSLLEDIRRQHATLRLQQHLPATTSYPFLTVVDVIPGTAGQLSEGTSLIVLPPVEERAALKSTPLSITQKYIGRGAAPLATISLDRHLVGNGARLASDLFEALFVPEEAILRVGDDEYSCAFTVSKTDDDGWTLYASEELFRNIRAAYVHHGLRPTAVSFTYGSPSFEVSIDFLVPLENEEGDVVCYSGNPTSDSTLLLERLRVCPAVDPFFLKNLLGDHYAEFLSTLLMVAMRRLNRRLLSEGDVFLIPMCSEDFHSCAERLEAYDVVETLAQCLHHKVQNWEGVWSLDEGRETSPGVPFRVVEAASKYSGLGVLTVESQPGSFSTEVVLASQDSLQWLDGTPLLAPTAQASDIVSVEAAIHACLTPCLTPLQVGHGYTFVVHGVKENVPYLFVQRCLRHFGLLTMVVSADSLQEENMRLVLDAFGNTQGHVALVISNAQTLATEHPELLTQLEVPRSDISGVRLLFLMCESVEALPPSIAARATNPEGVIECGNPSDDDRQKIIQSIARAAVATHNVHLSLLLSFEALAAWTVGLSYADVTAYTNSCVAQAWLQGCSYPDDVQSVLSDKVCEEVLQTYMKTHGHNLVSTKLQPVRWSDVGGLEDAKRELRETIQLPILHPDVFASGMKKRTGILFYGPPGCGKTLLARAVATEMNMNFISVKGPELINQYVGESERNIRLLFQRARDSSPCIVFFDELDALAPARGAKGDAGGAMDRIVSQLLVEVDGVGQKRSDGSDSGDVFIIGATNRPDLLDPSLLRPGRFDRLCYLGIPTTRDEQIFALKALTRKFALAEDVNFHVLLEPMEAVYTGADLFALSSDAMMFAVEETLERAKQQQAMTTVEDEGDESGGEDNIYVSMEHFVRARNQLKASVTKEDLRRYEAMKTKFDK